MDNLPSQPIGYEAVSRHSSTAYQKVFVPRLFVERRTGRKKIISLSNICAFSSNQKYTTVYFLEKGQCCEVDIATSIVKLMPTLPERFVTTHRGVVVDSRRIIGYDSTPGKVALVEINGVVTRHFPVSRRRRAAVNKLFKAMEA